MNAKRPATLTDTQLLAGSVGLLFAGVALALGAPDWLLNVARVFVLLGAIYILVASAVIVRVYYRNYLIAPAQARLLPRHVVQLGALVVLLLLHACSAIIDRVDGPVIWYSLPVLMPAVFIGAFGLRDMLAWLPRRRDDLKATGVSSNRRRDDLTSDD